MAQSMVGVPSINGEMMCELAETVGQECNLVFIVARYPINLHTHDDVSYQPPLIIEGLVNGYTPFTQICERPHLETNVIY